MNKFLIVFPLFFFYCTSQKKERYYTKSKESYIEIDFINEKEALGTHCFIFENGNKIDCCIEENSISLKLNKDNHYEGNLHSCYDEDNYKILLIKGEKNVILKFIDDDYPFLSSEISFYLN